MSKKKEKIPDGPFAQLAALKKKLADDEAAAKKQHASGAPGSSARTAPAPTPARARPAARSATPANAEEDALSFHRLMNGVVPLEGATSACRTNGGRRTEQHRNASRPRTRGAGA